MLVETPRRSHFGDAPPFTRFDVPAYLGLIEERESLDSAVRKPDACVQQSCHLDLLRPSLHGHRPQTFCRPQAAQRAGALTLSTPFAAPARTIAQAPPAAATHAAVCASVTCIRRARAGRQTHAGRRRRPASDAPRDLRPVLRP